MTTNFQVFTTGPGVPYKIPVPMIKTANTCFLYRLGLGLEDGM